MTEPLLWIIGIFATGLVCIVVSAVAMSALWMSGALDDGEGE